MGQGDWEPPFPDYDPFRRTDIPRKFHVDDQAPLPDESDIYDQIGKRIVEKYRGDYKKMLRIKDGLSLAHRQALDMGVKNRDNTATLLSEHGLGFLIGDISQIQGEFNKGRDPKRRVRGINFYDKQQGPQTIQFLVDAVTKYADFP